jgi:hypothetical protein
MADGMMIQRASFAALLRADSRCPGCSANFE